MSKEERYTYHCDQYDYVEVIYDNEECEEIDSMKMAEKRLNRQQDKITDLEAKLAEKEHTINTLIEDHKASQEWYKMQLAQKDKQLEKLKSENHALISDNAYQEADMFEFNSRIEQLQKQLAEKDQDKISFCIEQLEKVEELVKEKSMTQSPFGTQKIYANDVSAIIYSQIKQLKGME